MIDPTALWALAAIAVIAAAFLLAGLLATLAQQVRAWRNPRPGYMIPPVATEAEVVLTDWAADPDNFGFDGWDDRSAA